MSQQPTNNLFLIYKEEKFEQLSFLHILFIQSKARIFYVVLKQINLGEV